MVEPPIKLSNCVLVERLSNEDNDMQGKQKKEAYDVSQKCRESWAFKFP
jgi:hypothetical protein